MHDGGFSHIASFFIGSISSSEEGTRLTELSNARGPTSGGALASSRAQNKDESRQAAQKEIARLVG